MTHSFGKARIATATALLCMGAFGTIAAAHDLSPKTRLVGTAAGVNFDSQSVGDLAATVRSAEAKINASASQKRALLRASTDAEIKAVLMSNGFTANQLIGVKASQATRGRSPIQRMSAARVKITIKCCPWEIIISW